MRALARAAALLVTLLPASLLAQTGGITGALVSKVGEMPLPFGIIELEGTSRSLFSNDAGRFTIRALRPGHYRMSVRRLGYKPAIVAIEIRAGVMDTITVRMERVAVSLTEIVVAAHPACTAPGAPPVTDTVLSPIVAQLKLNAEQMRVLTQQYPHEYSVEVNKRRMRGDTMVNEDLPRLTTQPGKTKSSYMPGAALRYDGRKWGFVIPELVDVADPSFIALHCWHYAGVHLIDDRQHFRVDVVASAKLTGVDIDGSFYVDAESFQIRRSVVRLSRRPPMLRGVLDYETTTEYKEFLPSVPIIAFVRAVQSVDPKTRMPYSEVVEEHNTFLFRFTGRTPGDVPTTVDSIREAGRGRKPDRY